MSEGICDSPVMSLRPQPTTSKTMWTKCFDAVVAKDPGLHRLMAGWRALVSIAVGIGVGAAIGPPAGETVLTGVMIGGLLGFITAIAVSENVGTSILKRCSASYLPFIIGLPLSLALHPYRVAELTLLVIVLFIHMYANQFGPYGHDFGTVLFATFLSGLLLPFSFSATGGIAVIGAVSLAAVTLARFVFCRMRPDRVAYYAERGLRTRMGWVLATASAAIRTAGSPSSTAGRSHRLRRQAHLMNEAALLADAYLGQRTPSSTGDTAERMHRLIFDTEQSIQSIVRIVEQLSKVPLPPEVPGAMADSITAIRTAASVEEDLGRAELEDWLESLARSNAHADDHVSLWVYRFLIIRQDIATLGQVWRTGLPDESIAQATESFTSPVALLAGKLPGSTLLGRRAVVAGGLQGGWARWKVSPHLRTALQATVAVAIVTPIGDLIDPDRFYWADIGVLIILSATTTTHDRIRKVGHRFVGTVIGGVVGIWLSHLLGTGDPYATATLVTLSLALGVYCLGTYYPVWVFGLVVALCQVYNLAGGVSDELMFYRLVENMVGAVIAVVVAMLILPISTRSVTRFGLGAFFDALQQLLAHAREALVSGTAQPRLRHDARALDSAAYELDNVLETVLPLSRRSSRTHDQLRMWLHDIAHSGRELAKAGAVAGQPAERQIHIAAADVINDVWAAAEVLRQAVIDDQAPTAWNRSGEAVDHIITAVTESTDPATARLRHILHQVGLIDDALANWAGALDAPVTGRTYGEYALRRGTLLPVRQLRNRAAYPQCCP